MYEKIESTQNLISLNDRGFVPISFDKRVKWFIGICIGLLTLLTIMKLHLLSVPMWNQLLPDGSDPRRGLIAGQPRQIRMDDYAAGIPFYLSQSFNNLSTENFSIGGEHTPLVFGLPVKHFTLLFKPQLWGFLFLDTERAVSFGFFSIIVFGLISSLFVFLLITKNNFWLSVLGSFWIVFSSGTVWWVYFSTLSFVWSSSLLFVVFFYLIFERKPIFILLQSALLTWLTCCQAFVLYPTFQVPYAYFLLILLIGFLHQSFNKEQFLLYLPLKISAIILTITSIGIIGYLYYTDAKDTISVMANTVYPGKRSETGGTGFIANYFSEYFSWLVNERNLPQHWLNICEVSHYITFAPFIIFSLIGYFVYSRKIDFSLTLIAIYIVFMLIWIEIGFPSWLAKITFMSTSPTRRTQIPFGVANIFFTILYLSKEKSLKKIKGFPQYVLFLFIIFFMAYVTNYHQQTSKDYFKIHQLILPAIFFIVLHILLINRLDLKYKSFFFGIGIVVFLIPNLKAHPLSIGLSPITEHKLFLKIREVAKKEIDKNAVWVVNGSQYISYMLTATGVKNLGGIKIVPNFKVMHILDPTAKRDSVYNRFAHTVYYSYINGTDTTVLSNNFEDAYSVGIDPCSPKLKKLNVKYMIFEKQPQAIEVRCMSLVDQVGTIQIYRRND